MPYSEYNFSVATKPAARGVWSHSEFTVFKTPAAGECRGDWLIASLLLIISAVMVNRSLWTVDDRFRDVETDPQDILCSPWRSLSVCRLILIRSTSLSRLNNSGLTVRPPIHKKIFFDLNEIWYQYVGRGWWVHDGMPYNPMQDYGGLKCVKVADFRVYLLHSSSGMHVIKRPLVNYDAAGQCLHFNRTNFLHLS